MTTYTGILNNLYEVLIEANFCSPIEDIGIESENDADIVNALQLIRKLNVKTKAELNSRRYAKAKILMENFMSSFGNRIEEAIAKLESEPENEPAVAFFRSFQKLSESDKTSMLMDVKMLDFINKAKEILGDEKSEG
jgi:hypothetical protein